GGNVTETPESPESIAADAVACVGRALDRAALDKLRVEFLGKKGRLTGALRVLGSLPASERPVFGQRVNQAKEEVDKAIAERETEIRGIERAAALEKGAVDVTLPAAGVPLGTIHPISRTMTEICEILGGMGFEI